MLKNLCAAFVSLCLLGHYASATIIPAEPQHQRSLDGTWRFRIEDSAAEKNPSFDFNQPGFAEDASWHDIKVPGNWEMAGFSPATYNNDGPNVVGMYRLKFDVPAEWKGRTVKLNFDGVQNGAELFLNGQPVSVDDPSNGRTNYHEGGFTAFQVDLTPAVRFGKSNLLALRVLKKTKSSNMDTGDYFFLAGVHRPVTLFSVPISNISDIAIRTGISADRDADLTVKAVVANASPGEHVSIHLADGSLGNVEVKDGLAELKVPVQKPTLWSAEHPNLIDLSVDLLDAKDQIIQHTQQRIGFREVSIEDGVLTINHVPVKLTGICRHEVYPTLGSALNEEIWRKDLLLMKAANINAVRTSHYPYGRGFYDLCDELGLYVADEMAACWVPTDTDELSDAFKQHARETVQRDKNHPSVILWAIGNENPAGKNDKIAADEIRRLDPSRPRLVSRQLAEEAGVEFDDLHYTSLEKIQKTADDTERRQKYPQIYLENPNIWEARNGADIGALDAWAPVIDRNWKIIWTAKYIPGSFLWEWQDRAIADPGPEHHYDFFPETGINLVKVKGLVDGFRNPRPDYYHVKMAYTPIAIDLKPRAVQADHITVRVINRYSFTDLADLKTSATLISEDQSITTISATLKLSPLTEGDLSIALPADALSKSDTVRLSFDHAEGGNIATYDLPLKPHAPASPKLSAIPASLQVPRLNLVAVTFPKNARKDWTIADRKSATLSNIQSVPTDIKSLADLKSMSADIVLPGSSNAVGTVQAKLEGNHFSYTINWTGKQIDVQELGWLFTAAKADDHFSWRRQAYWSYYPPDHIGRPFGTATPDSAQVNVTQWTRPDAFDFNSTKYNCDWATLTDSAGHGIGIHCDESNRQQCRGGIISGGGYELLVNKQVSPPRDLSSNIVPDLYLKLDAGQQVSSGFDIGAVEQIPHFQPVAAH